MCGKFEKPGILSVYPRVTGSAHPIIDDIFGNGFDLPEKLYVHFQEIELGPTRKNAGKSIYYMVQNDRCRVIFRPYSFDSEVTITPLELCTLSGFWLPEYVYVTGTMYLFPAGYLPFDGCIADLAAICDKKFLNFFGIQTLFPGCPPGSTVERTNSIGQLCSLTPFRPVCK